MACVRRRRDRWFVDFRDRDGKRRWETYDTRKEADDALSKRLQQLKRGTCRAPAELPTFRKVAKDWLASKADRRVSTLAQWQVHLDLHILPAFANLRLDQISVADVERFRDERRKAGLAPQSVNKLLTTAAEVFKYAARHELTDRNPAAVAERCRLNAAEVVIGVENGAEDNTALRPDEVLSPEGAAPLIAASDVGFYQTYFLTAVLTGARVGELSALIWNDVDLDAGTVAIRPTVSWAKPRGTAGLAKPRFYEPKTKSSRRTIPLPPELVSTLRRWKLACPPSPSNLVFPNAEGSPRHRSTIAHDGLRPALKRAGLRPVTIHSLRHTFALEPEEALEMIEAFRA
jgi:integrase